MSDPIGALALRNIQGLQSLSDGPKSISIDVGKGDGPSFGDTLKKALGEVSTTQDNATDQMQRFMRGEPVELHQVMPAAEEAGIALEMLVDLLNKFTEAYRTLVNMQS
jgi:flagellar hook-basal body complex protein FliE